MNSPLVAEVLDLFKSKPQLLGGPAEVAFTSIAAGVTRPTVNTTNDPLLVYATLDYKPATFDRALQEWKDIVADTAKTEPKTHMYNCLKDTETDHRVRMFEAYEDMAAFEAHCSTEILKKKIVAEEKNVATKPQVVFLKRVKGYLHKEQGKEELQRL